MSKHIITRTTNKSQHPGTPDLPAPQRSSQVVQEEHAAHNLAVMAARLQQQEHIRQAAEIEDQLHEQSKMQRTKFQNPTMAMTRSVKPKTKLKTATESDGAISSKQSLSHVQGRIEGDGQSQEVGSEKDTASDTELAESVHREPESDNDAEIEETCKKPAKLTRLAIESARATKAKPKATEVTSDLLTPGKRKLQCEGAIFFGPSVQKKMKPVHPSGLTNTYQRVHKKGIPADAQRDLHSGIEAQTTDKFGGLPDKQEVGWKPAKGQSTMGPLAVTKIIAKAPQERLQASAPVVKATASKNRPSHQNLPTGSSVQFSRVFTPLLRLYCGTLDDPWMTPDDFLEKLQVLWDAVMLDWEHWFDEDDNVYRLCLQKTYEWRAHIGKAGIETVEALWASDPKYENPKERKVYVDFALGSSLPFMYGSVEHVGGDQYRVSKSFLLPLVLRTFASHIKDVSAVDNDTYHKLIDNAMPRGALVLAVTSVEQALTLYSTRVKDVPSKRSEASFSDIRWGTKTLLYTRSIAKVGHRKFEQIASGAQEYCSTASRSRQVQVTHNGSGEIDMKDDRALIVVSSDIEAELDGEGKFFLSSFSDILNSIDWTEWGGEMA